MPSTKHNYFFAAYKVIIFMILSFYQFSKLLIVYIHSNTCLFRLSIKMNSTNAKRLERLLFTTSEPTDTMHHCVIVWDKKHAITFAHGRHSLLKEGTLITLHNVLDLELKVEVCFKI